MIYYTLYISPLGDMTLASDGENLLGLWFAGQKYEFGTIHEDMIKNDDLEIFFHTKKWLDLYFRKQKPALSDLSLAPRGSEFRKIVWQILCEIPYGEVMTYGQIAQIVAQKMGRSNMSAQAIGGAVGHNPLSVIIPCHRVVGSQGNLTGYAGGIDKKLKLLEIEDVDIHQYKVPQKGTAV